MGTTISGTGQLTNQQLLQPDDTSNAQLQAQETNFFNNPDYQDQLKWFLSDAMENGATDPDHLGKLKGTIGAALIAHLAASNPQLLGQLMSQLNQTKPGDTSINSGGVNAGGGGGGSSGGAGGTGNTGGTGGGGGSTGATGGTGGSGGGSSTSSASGGSAGTAGSVQRGNPTKDTYAQQDGTQTKDGSYTEAQCEDDIKKLAQSQGKPLPDAATIKTIATGIIKGINANFSGVNTIGDFSKYSGAQMGKLLVSSAFQESDFGLYGEDDGGIFQCADIRLQQYNQANGTNYSEADLKNDPDLACDVGIWAMSTVEGTLGQQAPGSTAQIPGDLGMQALYYWNYHGGPGHGHADELADYMQQAQSNLAILGGSAS